MLHVLPTFDVISILDFGYFNRYMLLLLLSHFCHVRLCATP